MNLNDMGAVNRANRLLLFGLVGSMLLHAAVLMLWRVQVRKPASAPSVELRLNASLTRMPVASAEPAAQAAPVPVPAAPTPPVPAPEPKHEPMPVPKAETAQSIARAPLVKSGATPVRAVPAPVGAAPYARPAPPVAPPVPTAPNEPVADPASLPGSGRAPGAQTTASAPTASSLPPPSAAPGAGDSSQTSKESPPPLTADERAALALYRLHMDNMIRHFDGERTTLDRTNWEGVTVLLLRVGADGGLASLTIVSSSGDVRTDRQARTMMLKSHREVQLPKVLQGKPFQQEYKLRFEAK